MKPVRICVQTSDSEAYLCVCVLIRFYSLMRCCRIFKTIKPVSHLLRDNGNLGNGKLSSIFLRPGNSLVCGGRL